MSGKDKQAIALSIGLMVLTIIIFLLVPKPASYGKAYLQFSFIFLSELVCTTTYIMLPKGEKYNKTFFLGLYFIATLIFNGAVANMLSLRLMIGINVLILLLLLVCVLVIDYKKK